MTRPKKKAAPKKAKKAASATKRAAPKKAKKAASAAKKAAPKKAAKASFAEHVRRHVAEACAGWRFVETSGGSGPLVTFERPAPKSAPHLRERVVFQKGLHGADWFRVNFFPSIEGAGASGPLEHALFEGATLGPDVRWATDAELDAALAAACARVEGAAEKEFAPAERHYAALDALFGDLVGHYTRFLAKEGAKLPPEAFFDDEESNPPTIAAFDAFRAALAKAKLLPVDPKLDLETPLWRFWHSGRPMRATDYRKDDYYDCTKCGAFTSFKRGKLVASKLAGFGVHHAFVCGKH